MQALRLTHTRMTAPVSFACLDPLRARGRCGGVLARRGEAWHCLRGAGEALPRRRSLAARGRRGFRHRRGTRGLAAQAKPYARDCGVGGREANKLS